MRLRPFFSYYGSKYRLSPKYPSPRYKTIIEPFAGSACYSLCYTEKLFPINVELYDKNEIVCAVWDYLINVKQNEFLKLPLLNPGEKIPSTLPIEAQYLLGFWVTKAATSPRRTMAKKTICDVKGDLGYWSEKIKNRISNQLKYVRHWTIKQSCYSNIENKKATWFIDPPYQVGGTEYPHNSVSFEHLSLFCKELEGQVIVCENSDANWLPFKTFWETKGMKKNTREVMWSNCA